MITNNKNLPQVLVDIVSEEQHEPIEKRFGVTTLLQNTREIILKRRHWKDIDIDVSDCINTLFGTSVHYIIEKYDKTKNAEIKFEQEIKDGYKIVGKIDLYDQENMAIVDWKTCSLWKVKNSEFSDWKMQGLIYAWLLMKNAKFVEKITFYAFIKDWKKDCGYPQVYTYEYKIQDGDLQDIERFVNNKIDELIRCEKLPDNELPMCEDTWKTSDVYGVYKSDTAERATRNFTTLEEANLFIKAKGGVLKIKKGCNRKCQEYCDCKCYCKYFMEEEV